MPRNFPRLILLTISFTTVLAFAGLNDALEQKDETGLTPLLRAANLHHLDLAAELLKSGASPATKSDAGQGLYWIALYGTKDLGEGPAPQDAHSWVFKQLSNRLATKDLREVLFQTYYEEDLEEYHPLLRQFEFTFRLMQAELIAKAAPVAQADREREYRQLTKAIAIYSEAVMALNSEGRLLPKPLAATQYSGARTWSYAEDIDIMMQSIESYVVSSAVRLGAQNDALNESLIAHIFCMAEISWNLRPIVPRELALGVHLLDKLSAASPTFSKLIADFRGIPADERGQVIRMKSLPFLKNALGVLH